jgi:hypothetical protein
MSCVGARGCSVDEQSRVIKYPGVHRRRESCAARAVESKRVRRGKAASETRERGRSEKKRSAREVVVSASSYNFNQKSRLLSSVGSPLDFFCKSGNAWGHLIKGWGQPGLWRRLFLACYERGTRRAHILDRPRCRDPFFGYLPDVPDGGETQNCDIGGGARPPGAYAATPEVSETPNCRL